MFTGIHRHNIDAKGRLFLPVDYRNELGEKFMVTRGLENCLRLYPMNEWEAFVAKVAALPESKARAVRRYFFANAFETNTDAQGRITIPPDCRTFANLEKEVVLVGDISRVEIWNESEWDKLDEENRQSIIPLLDELEF